VIYAIIYFESFAIAVKTMPLQTSIRTEIYSGSARSSVR